MKSSHFTYRTCDNIEIYTYLWQPEGPLKGALQIAHGMAEHALRYEGFAKFLVEKGFAVYANDHRGHGKTAGSKEKLGYFAPEDGWNLVVGDMVQLSGIIKKKHPDTPLFLFGHSLGSMLLRSYLMTHSHMLKGAILSGTGGDPGLIAAAGSIVARVVSLACGKEAQSPLLDKMSFGEFNKAFKPNRTPFDWLSRDEAEVDKYIKDPYCGTVFTAGFFEDLLYGVKEINKKESFGKIWRDLPIFVFSGDKDPVGDKTKGVKQVMARLKKAGVKKVSHKFYEGGRHEMLNETNKKEVFADIHSWLLENLG